MIYSLNLIFHISHPFTKCLDSGNAGRRVSQVEVVTRPQATQTNQVLDRCLARASEAAGTIQRFVEAADRSPEAAARHPTNHQVQDCISSARDALAYLRR